MAKLMESSKRHLDPPSKSRYSQRTASGEVECQFGPFYSRCNRIIIERVQRCLYVDIQGSKRYPTSLGASLN
jgi:hypothetical protein